MPSLSDRERVNLEAALTLANKIEIFIEGITNHKQFYDDEKTFDSVLMNFVIIGESAARLSDELKTSQSLIPWNKIKAFRNFVAHNYFGLDSEEIWQLNHSHLPQLKNDVKKILE